jgi:hypothetical protein
VYFWNANGSSCFEKMNSGGPQSVRDKSWLRKPAELAGEREELIVDRNAEKQVRILWNIE